MCFSAMCKKMVEKKEDKMRDKEGFFSKLFLIKISPPPPQQIRTERLSRGDFQLLAFAHKPIWKSGPALRCAQKCRNLDRMSGR